NAERARRQNQQRRHFILEAIRANRSPSDVDELGLPLLVLDRRELILRPEAKNEMDAMLQDFVDELVMGLLRLDPSGKLHALALLEILARHPVKLALMPFENAAFAFMLMRHGIHDDATGLGFDRDRYRFLISHRREGRLKRQILKGELLRSGLLAFGRRIGKHPAVFRIDPEDLLVDSHAKTARDLERGERLPAAARAAETDHRLRG